MSKIYKAFVYLWYDKKYHKYYLGYHKGHNKNYICSSESMLKEYKQRPQDFKRRVLKYGTEKQMIKLEGKLLKKRLNRFGKQYYNLAWSFPAYINITPEIREKLRSMKGKKHTEETKRKMSEKLKGRIFSEEWKIKIKKARKNQIINHSEETKRKMSESHKLRRQKIKQQMENYV